MEYLATLGEEYQRHERVQEQGKSEGFDSCDRPSNLTQIGFKSSIFQPLWPWNLMDDQKNNRAHLLCYFKLFASFHSHWWIQTGVTVWKPLIWVNIDAFFSLVALKFDGWPSKTIGHLFYATSSFMYHFVAIGEFKLELESGNAQSGSNSTLFRAVWPWNLTDDLQKKIGHLFYATSSFVQHFVAIGEFKLEQESRNAQSGSNSTLFRAVWPWNLTDDLQKQ